MEIRLCRFGSENNDVRRQVIVEGVFYFFVGKRAVHAKMRHKTPGMHPAVGAGTADEAYLLAGENFRKTFLKNFLDRPVIFLALPTFVAGAVKPD